MGPRQRTSSRTRPAGKFRSRRHTAKSLSRDTLPRSLFWLVKTDSAFGRAEDYYGLALGEVDHLEQFVHVGENAKAVPTATASRLAPQGNDRSCDVKQLNPVDFPGRA